MSQFELSIVVIDSVLVLRILELVVVHLLPFTIERATNITACPTPITSFFFETLFLALGLRIWASNCRIPSAVLFVIKALRRRVRPIRVPLTILHQVPAVFT